MRFFIIDQSLYDAGGHSFDYAKHAASAVTRQGWQAIILAHKTFDTTQAIQDVGANTPHPVFTQGSREGATLSVRLRASALTRLERLARPLAPQITTPWFEPLYPRARRFLRDLVPALKNLHLTPGDKLFFTNPSWADLVIISENLQNQIDLSGIDLHAALRFDPPAEPKSLDRLKRSPLLTERKIKLWADTVELSKVYSEFLDYDLHLLAIPVLTLKNKSRSDPIRISFLGESRIDKGFHTLPSVINEFSRTKTQNRYQFFIQILDDPNRNKDVLKASHELEDLKNENITLHKGPLGSQLYKEALEKSDIILCLHEAEKYQNRSAGIITQAASSGIPLVMKDGPSSPRSMILRNGREDIVRFCDNRPENIAKAIRSAAEIPEHHPRTLDCVDNWGAPWKNL